MSKHSLFFEGNKPNFLSFLLISSIFKKLPLYLVEFRKDKSICCHLNFKSCRLILIYQLDLYIFLWIMLDEVDNRIIRITNLIYGHKDMMTFGGNKRKFFWSLAFKNRLWLTILCKKWWSRVFHKFYPSSLLWSLDIIEVVTIWWK